MDSDFNSISVDSTRPIEEEEFVFDIEPIYRQVFEYDGTSFIDYSRIFSASIEGKIVIYRCPHFPEEDLLEAIVQVASSMGESGFYMSGTCLEPERFQEMGYYRHWYIHFDDVFDIENDANHPIYSTAFMLASNQYYSPRGTWGLRTNDDYFGIIGGTSSFIENIRREIPDLDSQVFDFLKRFRAIGVRDFWLFDLLAHVYGEAVARSMMQQYGFPSSNIRAHNKF